jgi:homoserine acetyltransferase
MNGKKVYTPHEMRMRGLRGARKAAHIRKMNSPDILDVFEKERVKRQRDEDRLQKELQDKYLNVVPQPPQRIKRKG